MYQILCLKSQILFISILFFCTNLFAQEIRTQTCLNGWWDFQPVLTKEGKKYNPPGQIPQTGWLEKTILVPGSWSRGGCQPTNEVIKQKPWEAWRIFDSYGYPVAWDSANTAWYKRTFNISEKKADRRYFLYFGGILRESWIIVNSKTVGHRNQGTMPSEYEITDQIHQGNNELVVYVTDYKRDENSRTLVHIGWDQMQDQKGIWQDVFLIEKPDVYIDDITIRTSVRKNELVIIAVIKNSTDKIRTVKPVFKVKENELTHLTFSAKPLRLNPGQVDTIEVLQSWKSYIPWSPKTPQLYYLHAILEEAGKITDYQPKRFGFREIWIDKHNIILNGSPIHLFGEWGHKFSFDFFRPEYVRQWFHMLKDCNMNYIRTHTFPHPQFMLDLADEMGIMICLESSWFFSGQAVDKDEYWVNAEQHVRDIIHYDKNHPSIILWSTGNEVRWGWNINPVIKNGPRIQKLYGKLDPTRVAYSDGSTSLWDEKTQPLISRHYGSECTGEDGWDKSKPLHVGEYGKWHYGQPIDNTVWGNDNVFASFSECHKMIAFESADIAEQARANEAACVFPWNLSCLDNFRPLAEEHKFTWKDVETPYVKPLRSAPYGSEFAWWNQDGKGYSPGVSFNIMKHAFRPLAVVVREKLNQAFDDAMIKHTVTVVNDLGEKITGSLSIQLLYENKEVWRKTISVSVEKGHTGKTVFDIPAVKVNSKTKATIVTTFSDASQVYDTHTRNITITQSSEKNKKWHIRNLAVFGDGSIDKLLKQHDVSFVHITKISDINPQKTPLLLIEKNAVQPGSDQNRQLSKFLSLGGNALILEQLASIMPQVKIENKPSERCHIRGGQDNLLKDFVGNDFEYWGNDPFGKTNSESLVIVNPYRKPQYGNTKILLDCGNGDFGSGGLNWTPLFETRVEKGLAVACQLRISEKAENIPSAMLLLEKVLIYLDTYQSKTLNEVEVVGSDTLKFLNTPGSDLPGNNRKAENAKIIFLQGKSISSVKLSGLAERVDKGATLIISGVDDKTVGKISEAFSINLKTVNLDTIFNLVRVKDNPLLQGISNQETYWLDKGQYCSLELHNNPMSLFLIKCEQGESLLESESESCWREFYTKGAGSEATRMPVITYYLWNGPREHASGLLQIPKGKGQIILCQIPVKIDYEKANIFWSQFFNNLDVKINRNLFEGESVIPGSKLSDGFPLKVKIVSDPSSEMVAHIIEKGDPGELSERFRNQGLNDGFDWKTMDCKDGTVKFQGKINEAMLYFELKAGRPRKMKPVTGGLPDPSQQTLLTLKGRGKATLYVNGRKYETINTGAEGKATISDIELEQYWNSILIHWIPEGDTLHLEWKNRQGQPEVEFGFE